MGGAIGVALPAFALSRRRERGWLGARFDWPRATQIDRRLLLGGALFSVGWGMAGCAQARRWCCWARAAAGAGLCRGDAGRDVAGGQAVACQASAAYTTRQAW